MHTNVLLHYKTSFNPSICIFALMPCAHLFRSLNFSLISFFNVVSLFIGSYSGCVYICVTQK